MSPTKKPAKRNPEALTAVDVITALTASGNIFAAPAHCLITNVRNTTGFSYGGTERFADALAVSLWPSRGVWLAGVEVKVLRSDWRRELVMPEKSEAVQKFCTYWWIATPPGVIEKGELPETWGHIVVEGRHTQVEKMAPKLRAEPMTPAFVASVLRAYARDADDLRQQGHSRGYAAAMEEVEHDRETSTALTIEVAQLRAALGESKLESDRFKEFCVGAGIHVGRYDNPKKCGEAYALAHHILRTVGRYEEIIGDAVKLMSKLRELRENKALVES